MEVSSSKYKKNYIIVFIITYQSWKFHDNDPTNFEKFSAQNR